MTPFIFSKIQAEAGQKLEAIIIRKEAERVAGSGIFWWGIGNSLGNDAFEQAKITGTLPVLFSQMLSKPQKKDIAPEEVFEWTAWEKRDGTIEPVPNHVSVTSRGGLGKVNHYALVCYSEIPLTLGNHGPFDPACCITLKEKKPPGSSQVTALLLGDHCGNHSEGRYQTGFRATLVDPWVVKLVKPRLKAN